MKGLPDYYWMLIFLFVVTASVYTMIFYTLEWAITMFIFGVFIWCEVDNAVWAEEGW